MKSSPASSANKLMLPICCALAFAVLVVFFQVWKFEFIAYDDCDYVAKNEHVQQGLTAIGLKWAFTTGHASNWHPLTWVSHMIDWEIHGNKPGGHHFTNVLFHVANTLLVLLLLRKLTGLLWSSVFVAALFGLHPVHVESVAWVAERKDVLSTFFGLIALFCYGRFAQADRASVKIRHYLATLFFFACSLMSKPMLVTFPFVLLLLDFWPLKRVTGDELAVKGIKLSTVGRLFLEKIPFLALSIVSSIVTYQVQAGKTVQSLTNYSMLDRVSNVLVSYTRYLFKFFWPADLGFFYPLVKAPPLWQADVAGVLLLVVSVVILRFATRVPYALTGWFWYLGTLVPVVGIVHVGEQSHADRYTYIPSIGFFMAITWALTELVRRRSVPKSVVVAAGCAILAACSVVTFKQAGYWKNDIVMLERALAVTTNNFLAHNNYGVELARQSRVAEDQGKAEEAKMKLETAIDHYHNAIRVKPTYARAFNNLGSALIFQNKLDEAIDSFQKSLELRSDAMTHHNLALAFARQKKYQEAITHCREALRLNPNYNEAYYDLGLALSLVGELEAAVVELETAVRVQPNDPLPHYQLAVTFMKLKRTAEASRHFRETVRLKPDWIDALARLAWILSTDENPKNRSGADALQFAEQAGQLTGYQQPYVLTVLAAAHAELGEFNKASEYAQKAGSLAEQSNRQEMVGLANALLAAFRSQTPWRSK